MKRFANSVEVKFCNKKKRLFIYKIGELILVCGMVKIKEMLRSELRETSFKQLPIPIKLCSILRRGRIVHLMSTSRLYRNSSIYSNCANFIRGGKFIFIR